MDLDNPFGGGGEPGGEDDVVHEAAAVGAVEEILGEEAPAGPSRQEQRGAVTDGVGEAAQS